MSAETLSMAQARDRLAPQERVLSFEFAMEINAIAGRFPDNTLLPNLIRPWYWRVPPREVYRQFYAVNKSDSPKEWTSYMDGLNVKRKQWLGLVFERAMRNGAINLGDLRNLSEDTHRYHMGIGIVGKTFLNLAFRKREE